MKVLLDTNALVRILRQEDIPRPAQRILDQSATELLVGMVSAWEIAMKPQLRLAPADVESAIRALGATTLLIWFSHAEEYSRLPQYSHRDPFDRMLIARALAEDLTVLTADTRFPAYKRVRVVWN